MCTCVNLTCHSSGAVHWDLGLSLTGYADWTVNPRDVLSFSPDSL